MTLLPALGQTSASLRASQHRGFTKNASSQEESAQITESIIIHLRNKGVFAKCQKVFQTNISRVSVLMPPNKTNVAPSACDGTFAERGAWHGRGWRSSRVTAASCCLLSGFVHHCWRDVNTFGSWAGGTHSESSAHKPG